MVTHQLQVERRTGKVRQSKTDVLPLCHATNCDNGSDIEDSGVDRPIRADKPMQILATTLYVIVHGYFRKTRMCLPESIFYLSFLAFCVLQLACNQIAHSRFDV